MLIKIHRALKKSERRLISLKTDLINQTVLLNVSSRGIVFFFLKIMRYLCVMIQRIRVIIPKDARDVCVTCEYVLERLVRDRSNGGRDDSASARLISQSMRLQIDLMEPLT